MVQQPLVGHGVLIIEASRSHSDIPQSVGPLWTSDQPTQKPLPDKTQHLQEKDVHYLAGLQPTVPASERPQTHAAGIIYSARSKIF